MELIETYINLDEELEGFEVAFGILKNDEFVHFHSFVLNPFTCSNFLVFSILFY